LTLARPALIALQEVTSGQLAYLQGELSEFTPLCQFDTLTVPVVDPDPPRLLCSQEINEPQISQISAD
jgi:hypothetical protein